MTTETPPDSAESYSLPVGVTILNETYTTTPGTRLTICVLTLDNGLSVSGQSDFIRPPEEAQAAAKQDALRRLARFMHPNAGARYVPIEEVARIAHEINRAYCEAIGDCSQLAWERAPDWQRESALNGVRFHLEHHDATPAASHENWMREKLAAGWQYGPEKNAEAKTHPCLVPFEQLPLEQQVKDHLFRAVVRTLIRL